jgi:hypothetical protein
MPAYDQCHPQVVRALEREGWEVRESPYRLFLRNRTLYIDLALSRITQDNAEIIAVVEVKCFPESSAETTELYTSIGQYLVYWAWLVQKHVDADLYLAVPIHAYERVYNNLASAVLDELQIKMIVIDLEGEVVVEWRT